MAKFKELKDKNHPEIKGLFFFHCPGCKYQHPVHTVSPNPNGEVWEYNGSVDSPTISPSLLVNGNFPNMRCHSFIKDGKIQFLEDCFHELKGKTVDLPELKNE